MATGARRRSARPVSGGFTYLGLLFAIVMLGFALSAAGTLWSVGARRDREAQLLWVGNQYRHAIASYYLKGPVGLRQFPPSLEDLLEDRRGPVLLRHLRRLYPDPMTGTANWDLERLADGSIAGVRSAAQGRPIKQAGFGPELAAFEGAACYCDWSFSFVPPPMTVPGSGAL
jgi:type II secretory pathway pseudopilin PulG